MSPILVQVTFIFAYAILAEAALSFLGVGVPPEIPTWGTMVAGSQQYAHQAFWIVSVPGPGDHRSPRFRCSCWATASAICWTPTAQVDVRPRMNRLDIRGRLSTSFATDEGLVQGGRTSFHVGAGRHHGAGGRVGFGQVGDQPP